MTEGDNNTSEPWFYDVVANAKWKAWDAKRGMSKDAAMDKFIVIGERVLKEQGYGWATVNDNLPGPNYYDGCPNFNKS